MPFPRKPSWSGLALTAVASSVAAVFVARNFFEPEKKITQRIAADYAAGDPVFERVMGQLMGPPFTEGNRVTALRNGEEIFPAMREAIRSARETITLENFLWHEGRVAAAFAEALAERSRAGVRVHVLQDGFGCDHLHGPSLNQLRAAPVELEIFRAVWLSRMNYRTHRKLLVADGAVGFIGGVCLSDDWEGNGRTPGKWRDMHYRVEGPVVAQMQAAFLDNWMETRAEVLHGAKYFPSLTTPGTLRCQVFKSSVGEGADSARLMFLLSIAAARRHIRIASAFFLPDQLMTQTLIEARRRGVEIDVIAPGPDNDAPIVRLAGRSRWAPLLREGVRFWEYQPARFHCKYLIVDDCWCSVGSTNIDHRSLRLNEEVNLNVLDREFAASQVGIFEDDLAQSRRITLSDWKQRPVMEKLTGRAASVARLQM